MGGAGNDTIALTGTNFTLVDGGIGSNKLRVDSLSGLTIDLTTQAEKVSNFNQFDLSAGSNVLKINAAYIATTISSGQPGRFSVLGSADDTVQLKNTTDASWQSPVATQIIDSVTYDVWTNSIFASTDERSQLLVAQGINTTVI